MPAHCTPIRGLLAPAMTGWCILLASCQPDPPAASGDPEPPALKKVPFAARASEPRDGQTLFVAHGPEDTGLAPVAPEVPDHPYAYFYGSGMGAAGVAVGDIDQDGLPDVFLAGSPGGNRLYRQVSPLKFEDITLEAGLGEDQAWSRGAALVDVDNDGDLDLYVANYGQDNCLYINQGSATGGGPIRFVDEAPQRGVNVIDACIMPSFCDYDQDGDLDFYLLTNEFIWPDRTRPPDPRQMIGERDGKPIINPPFDRFFKLTDWRPHPSGEGFQVKWDRTGRPDFLLRNDGRGHFEEVTVQAGMEHGNGRGLSATWWDYNDDGYPDLYVGNDWMDRDYLYHNNGDGTFRDASEEALPHTPMYTMGADAGDLDNDGLIDLIAADMSGTTHYKRKISMGTMQADQIEFMASARPPQNMRNAVYLGTGTGRLLEAAYLMGLANSDWTWTVKIDDLDNDGRADVFVTNGMEQNIRELEGAPQPEPGQDLRSENNLVFRNLGDLRFEESGAAWGLDYFGFSLAAASCDFDRDGDLDLLVVQRDDPPVLHENTTTSASLAVELQGRSSNRDGIGATLRLETAGGVQVRQIQSCRGYLSSDELVAHFGLGEDTIANRLEIIWPSGHRQSFSGLESGHRYVITEPSGEPPVRDGPASAPTLFTPASGLSRVRHQERPFDDFALQPLLPNKLSQLGPGLAIGDLDDDGDEDFVLGGAAGQATQVVLNDGRSTFSEPQPLAGSERHEDMGLLLFDADSDGDRDLYAVSGSMESSGTDLADRLYLNDGAGNFSPAPEGSLPPDEQSGGPVAAADIDRDGDLDLFVGGRVVPGQYPLSPISRLLINEGGRFRDATASLASGLAEAGLVTAALFSDLDGDAWPDLILAREWGTVAWFRNEEGSFKQQDAPGLASQRGWWNGLAAGDLDLDGDLDLVATNFGYNTKYHASPGHPALLYYGTFGTDTMRLVEAEYEGETLYPVRGKSCSTRAIPHLAQKFQTFHSFALAELEQIYTPPVIEDAVQFGADTLASGVFLNQGDGSFEFQPLPRLAQIAPAFGVLINDLDGDGIPDLYLAQNFASAQPETGTMSGGMSQFLRGRGDGTFQPVGPRRSGIIFGQDATAACIADLDGDGWPDLLTASNNGPLQAFLNQPSSPRTTTGMFALHLEGQPGNLDAVGARATVELSNGSKQLAEVRAGEGYLSQCSPTLFFGTGPHHVVQVTVRWPDGSSSTHPAAPGTRSLRVSPPVPSESKPRTP